MKYGGIDEAKTILIIEDDREISNVVSMNVKDLGYAIDTATDGQTGLRKAMENRYSLIILDIMLPGIDGLDICREIRGSDPYTPIMMLTARSEEIDRVLGLELGADDYLTKPFSLRELTARIKALIRRSHTVQPGNLEPTIEETRQIGSIFIDFSKRKVQIDKDVLDLTVKEYELLQLFMRNPGRAYSRSDLLNIIWGYQFEGYEHTVNTHINRLRNKIEPDPSNPHYLETVWGVGYRFTENDEGE